jgi:MinD-like ATPase involved in chromosome partitioning or flagellar assembly
MTQSIAFHSYKGGTGKSTIAANLAAKLAIEGYNVSLLDLDVYAPSLQVYFDYTPKKWINDLLSNNAQLSDIMMDMTSAIKPLAGPGTKIGKLWLGFSNPQKEEIYKLEGGIGKQKDSKIQLLRKFIQLREDLIAEYKCDYIIIDTSPGIRFWSINSLALADTILLILKFGDLDIEGTKKMAADMYDSFTKHGTKSYLLLNRVAGYCIPNTEASEHFHHDLQTPITLYSDFGSMLSKEVGMDMISAVPCYCDIQFSRKEFLTALQHPEHPFAKQLHRLAESKQIKTDQ